MYTCKGNLQVTTRNLQRQLTSYNSQLAKATYKLQLATCKGRDLVPAAQSLFVIIVPVT